MANTVTLLDIDGNTVNTFSTIQDAVNAASSGDTLVCSAGTFQEQVTINGLQDLTIIGAGEGQTIIKSPDEANLVANLQNNDEIYSNQNAIVGIENNAGVSISNLTIDGNNQGIVFALFPQGAGREQGGDLVGLEALSSSVNVQNVHITGVEDVEGGVLQGGQGNKAIIVDDQDGSVQLLTVTGSTIDNFQKAGIFAEGAGLSVDINNNTVVGVGSSPTNISQNLIEVNRGAIGSVNQNAVSGVSDEATGSIGLLAFNTGDGLVVNGNAFAGLAGNVNSVGVLFEGANAPTVTGNTFTDQGLALAFYSPFTAAISQSGNTFTGNAENFQFIADTASTTPWLVTGTDGIDDLEGGAANDVFTVQASHASSTFVGNDGIDTVQGYTAGALSIQGSNWTVVNGADTDTLSGIEKVSINGQIFDLVDQLGAAGGFQNLQDAADAAQPGDIVLATAGATPVNVSLAVNNVTLEPSQAYTGITVTLTGNAQLFTLADFAPGQGTAVTVVANPGGGTITGNDADDHFIAGAQADTFVIPGSGTIIDQFGTNDIIDLSTLAFAAGATASLGGNTLTVTSNNVSQTVTLNNPAETTFAAISDGHGHTMITLDQPPVVIAGNSVGYTQGGAAAVLDATLGLSDPDNATLAGARVTITGGFVAGDALGFANQNGISGSYDPATGTLTLTGTASVALYQAALQSVTFSSTSDNPTNFGGNPTRQISWVANDGTLDSAAAMTTLNLTAVPPPSPFSPDFDRVLTGDFNGDGQADLVFHRSSDGATEILLDKNLVGSGGIVTTPFDQSWNLTTAGDFNGDGDTDLVFFNTTLDIPEIQFLNGTTPAGGGTLSVDPFNAGFTIVGAGDFNGDGKADLVWHRAGDGLSEIQFLNGTTSIGGGAINNPAFTSDWQIIGVGDFNGDGHSDLVFHRASDGLTEIQFLNGITPAGGGLINDPTFESPDWRVVGVGDFNGDGKSDLVFQDTVTNVTAIELLNGLTPIGGGVINNPAIQSPGFQVTGVGDFNGDGHPDLVFHNAATGATVVQLLNGITPIGGGTPVLH